MSAIRQDAWTDDEDLLLAETVLRHIREGSTQLAAFEEVGKALSRTPAACGFRWNSLIRKRYENAISLAKKQRKELSKKNKEGSRKRERSFVKVVNQEHEVEETEELTISKVIDFLRQLEGQTISSKANQQEIDELEQKIEDLKREKKDLRAENQELRKDFSTIKEDYQALIHIMDRARRFTEPSLIHQNQDNNEWEDVTEALTVNSKKD